MHPTERYIKFNTGTLNVTRQCTCRKIAPSFVNQNKHKLSASQPEYGESGEAIVHKASLPAIPFQLPFPSCCDAEQARRYLVFSTHMDIFGADQLNSHCLISLIKKLLQS